MRRPGHHLRVLLTLTSLGAMGCGSEKSSSDRDKEDDPSSASTQTSKSPEAGVPTDGSPDSAARSRGSSAETGSASLLTVRDEGGGQCQLVQIHLPGKTERRRGAVPCESQTIVLDENQERAWVGSALIDLTTGETLDTPELPERPNPQHPDRPNLVSHSHQFSAAGQPVLHATWGMGESEWYGAPQTPYLWSISEQLVFELIDGEWRAVATHKSGDGIPQDQESYATLTAQQQVSGQRITHGQLWPESTVSLDYSQSAEVNAQLHDIAGLDPLDAEWGIGGESPRIALREQWQGEYGCSTHPVLVSHEDEWLPLPPHQDSYDCIGVHRQGDWLLVVSHQPHRWTVMDLTRLKKTASGDGVTAFWPSPG